LVELGAAIKVASTIVTLPLHHAPCAEVSLDGLKDLLSPTVLLEQMP
jgi:hypothetical protein